jgi:hypothetical protein
MKEFNLKIGGYDAIIKDGKVLIRISEESTIEIPKDQIFMLSKMLEQME